jgi:serine/threonine protein kinase
MRASQLPTIRRRGTGDSQTARTAAIDSEPELVLGPATNGRSQERLVLGRYRLRRRLGAGAFGTVWMASDERLDRDVAVKIVPRERVIDGRLEREARAAARLQHPAIVTLYEAASDGTDAYLVSELVVGSTLDQLLHAGRLSDQDIIQIGLSLCDGLAHAHAHGVIHRDVKPSNILVPDRPSSPAHPAKLTDFGVARVIGGDSLTRTGDVVGTAAYMAPEQAEGRPTEQPADLYALALVLYEALTGVNPIRTGTAGPSARRLAAYLPPLRRQRRELPRELGRGIDLALRPRPRERGTIEELGAALRASLPAVDDTPGVVTGRWAPHTGSPQPPEIDHEADHELGPEPSSRREPTPALDPGPDREPWSWPARGLAALASALAAAWLATHSLAHGHGIPAAAALLAGGLTLLMPRVAWLATTVVIAIAALLDGQTGGALVVVVAGVIPVIVLPTRGHEGPLAAAAPALGVVGLAGAWPAIAARATRAWRRAGLALTGWVWLLLISALAGQDLYLQMPAGTPKPQVWTASVSETVHHVLAPIITSGALAGGLVWALAAVAAPALIRNRSPLLDAIRVILWAAVTAAATGAAIAAVHPAHPLTASSTAIGAVASAGVALAPTAVAYLGTTRE